MQSQGECCSRCGKLVRAHVGLARVTAFTAAVRAGGGRSVIMWFRLHSFHIENRYEGEEPAPPLSETDRDGTDEPDRWLDAALVSISLPEGFMSRLSELAVALEANRIGSDASFGRP